MRISQMLLSWIRSFQFSCIPSMHLRELLILNLKLCSILNKKTRELVNNFDLLYQICDSLLCATVNCYLSWITSIQFSGVLSLIVNTKFKFVFCFKKEHLINVLVYLKKN